MADITKEKAIVYIAPQNSNKNRSLVKRESKYPVAKVEIVDEVVISPSYTIHIKCAPAVIIINGYVGNSNGPYKCPHRGCQERNIYYPDSHCPSCGCELIW